MLIQLRLHLGSFHLCVEKSCGSGEKSFVLVTHDVANIGRQTRLQVRILKHFKLLAPHVRIKRAMACFTENASTIHALSVILKIGKAFEIGLCSLVISVDVVTSVTSIDAAFRVSHVSTEHSCWEVVALLILLGLL